MKKIIVFISLNILFATVVYSQTAENIVFGPRDSLDFNYYNFKLKIIMNDFNWMSVNDLKNDMEDMYCLHIHKKKDLAHFISNIDSFKNIKALSIQQVKIRNFKFLEKLTKLEFLSVDRLTNENMKSFVGGLNKNRKLTILEVSNLKTKAFPNDLNDLKFIKAIKLSHTKRLEYININLKIKHLILESNKNIKNINIEDVDYLSIFNSDLKKIPSGLINSANLKGLELSLNYKLQIECPIYGFKSLEIFDQFGQPNLLTKPIDIECFDENRKVEIYNPPPDYYDITK